MLRLHHIFSQQTPSNSNFKESQCLQKIRREALLSDKTIIVGKKVKVPFPGLGIYVCKIDKFNQDVDTYTLSHLEDDNGTGDMLFKDVVKLIPKSWLAKEHISHVNVISSVCISGSVGYN